MSLKKYIILIIIILLIDQISKVYVKTNFMLHDSIEVFSWFKIYFIENEGMAWGTRISDFVSFISDRTAKTFLTLFRIVAIFGIGYWLWSATKKKSSRILIVAIALIFLVWGIRSRLDQYFIRRLLKTKNPKGRYRLLKSINWVKAYQHENLEARLDAYFSPGHLGDQYIVQQKKGIIDTYA